MRPRIRLHHLDLLFPSYVLLAVIALWMKDTAWLGEWQWTFDNVNGTTVLLGPYAASAAAWRVVSADANDLLYSSTRRGWAVPLRTGAGVLVSAGIAWLLVAISGLLGTALVVHGGPAPVWVLVAGPIVLIACIAAGIGIGHLWSSRIAALLVAPTIFVLGGLGASGHLPNLLHQGPGSGTLAGLRWDPTNFWLEMTSLLLAAATFGLLSARRRASFRAALVVPPAASAAALVAVVMLTSSQAPDRFVDSSEQPDLCAAHAPAVCVAPSNARALPSLVAGFAEFVPVAKELGLDLPASFRAVLPAHHGGSDWGELILFADANTPVTPDQVVMALVTPGDCPAYFDAASPPPDSVHQAQMTLGTMLTSVHAGNRRVLRNRALLEWAQQTYRDLRACHLATIKPPPAAP